MLIFTLHLLLTAAIEYMNFFLYATISIVLEFMKEDDAQILKQLYRIVYTLAQGIVERRRVQLICREIPHCLQKFQERFGLQHMTLKFHLLLHMQLSVLDFGPWHGHSTWRFESLNKVCKQKWKLIVLCKKTLW